MDLNKKPLRRALLYTSIAALSVLTIQACDDDDDDPTSPGDTQNIVEVAQSDTNFTTFTPVLEQTGLSTTLEGDGPFTVFAPTNEAFNNLPDGFLDELSNEQLTEILSYHVIQNEISSGDFEPEDTEQSLLNEAELFITSNGSITVNDESTVVGPDIDASNGIIHSINRVLLPDAYSDVYAIIAKRYTLQNAQQAIQDAALVESVQQDTPEGYTIFTPDNDAFNTLPEDTLAGLTQEELQDLLTYHVLPNTVLSTDLVAFQTVETLNGDSLLIEVADETVSITDKNGNTYEVINPDLVGTNGVVHIINGVLIPSQD